MFEAEDLPEKYDEVNDNLESISGKIGTLRDCVEDKIDEICKDIDSLFKDVQNDLIIFDCAIESTSGSEKREWREKSKELHTRTAKFEQMYNTAKNNALGIIEESVQEEEESPEKAQRAYLNYGEKLIASMKKSAKCVISELDTNVKAINDINKEIKEQNEKLLEMEDVIKESQSTLKRAKELIDFFDKAFAKDMTLKIILVVICVVVLGIIVFLIVQKSTDNKQNIVTKAGNLIKGTTRVGCAEAMGNYYTAAVYSRVGLDCLEYNDQLEVSSNSQLTASPERELPQEVENKLKADEKEHTPTKRVLRLSGERKLYKEENTTKFVPISDEVRKLINTDHYFRTLKRNLNMIKNSKNVDQNL